jgi:hypothetical protein
VLKRTEAKEEKGKNNGGGDDGDDDADVIDQATFGLQPAAHYGFRHLFIYLFIYLFILRRYCRFYVCHFLCLYTRINVLILRLCLSEPLQRIDHPFRNVLLAV